MCTNLPAAWIVPQGVVGRQGISRENQSSSDNKRSVSVYKLTGCMDCATGCCWQARNKLGKSIKFRQQEVSECVQTYRLHGLCHRVLLAGKERDGKINQVQTTRGQ